MQALLNEIEQLKPLYIKKINNHTVIAQILLYDQFSPEFFELIQQFNTTNCICGFTAPANAAIIEKYGWLDGISMLKSNSESRKKHIQDAMEFVQQQRQLYIYNTHALKSNNKKAQLYLKDWVANYEISDYLRHKHIQNIFFVRNICWEHPEEMKKIEYEEKARSFEEVEFNGDKYFVDSPSTKEFIRRKDFQKLPDYIYVIDILGHFLVAVQLEIDQDRLILILDTMPNNRLENTTIKEFFLH